MTARTEGAQSRDKPAPKSRATGNNQGAEVVIMWSGETGTAAVLP